MQDQALSHAAELFEEGDMDKDGFLACEEMVALLKRVRLPLPSDVLPF